MGPNDEEEEYAALTPLRFCLWGWMKSKVYKRRVDKCIEVDAGIFEHLL
jgi:hypothetical protein